MHGDVYGKRFARESVVGAIDSNNNFLAGFAFKRYMNSDLFEGWLECVFVPAIKKRKSKNALLILDNANHPRRKTKNVLLGGCPTYPRRKTKNVLLGGCPTYHLKDRIYDIADEYGFTVIFLPKYSPDCNKIEKYWANIKNWLRLHLHKFDKFWDGLIHAFWFALAIVRA